MQRTSAQQGLAPPGVGGRVARSGIAGQSRHVISTGDRCVCRRSRLARLLRIRQRLTAEPDGGAGKHARQVAIAAGRHRPCAKENDQQYRDQHRPNRSDDGGIAHRVSNHSAAIVLPCRKTRYVSDRREMQSGTQRQSARDVGYSAKLCWKTWSHANAHGGRKYPKARTSSYHTDSGEYRV